MSNRKELPVNGGTIIMEEIDSSGAEFPYGLMFYSDTPGLDLNAVLELVRATLAESSIKQAQIEVVKDGKSTHREHYRGKETKS
jgi:hypothetical protein